MRMIIALLTMQALMPQDNAESRRQKVIEEFKKSDWPRQVARFRERKLALVEARIEAIGFIADRKNYTKHEGQEEVERRVDAVRKIWNELGQPVPKLSAKWHKLLAELRELGTPEDEPLFQTLEWFDKGEVAYREVPLEFEDGGIVEENRAARKHNDALRAKMEKREWELIEELNDYREMMGRARLKISLELVKTARGHSADMKKNEFLDHVSPSFGNPARRAAAQGYKGGLVGGNILVGAGAPGEAHRIWFRSAPHHRNMLSDRYTCVGVGFAGEYWTENFGKE